MELSSLDEKIWRPFFIGDLFKLETGKCSQANQLEKSDDGIPYIGATNRNNGVVSFVRPVEKLIQRGNCIAFIKQGEGSVGYSVYKAEDFIASTSVALGYADFLNRHVGMFITTVADKVRGRYSYNYPRSEARLKREKIMLPVTDDGKPDYEFMENYIRAHEEKILQRYRDYVHELDAAQIQPLSEKTWHEFLVGEIFTVIQRGKRLKTADHIAGDKPYISSSAQNNGVDNFIGNEENVRTFKDCLTIANSGSVGKSFYHSYEFVASDHVTSLSSEKLNRWHYLFIAAQLDKLSERYSFNREINDVRIRREKIMLPVTDDGAPDFKYMESYIRNVESEQLRRYLDYVTQKNNSCRQDRSR